MAHEIKFSVSTPKSDRVHHVTEEDVRAVLSRLPEEVWNSLRNVHFNDRSRGARRLGYVNRGRREIALCALPHGLASHDFSLRVRQQRDLEPNEEANGRFGQSPVPVIRRVSP